MQAFYEVLHLVSWHTCLLSLTNHASVVIDTRCNALAPHASPQVLPPPSISPKCCCQTYSTPSSIYSYISTYKYDWSLKLASDHLLYTIQDPPPCLQMSTWPCLQISLWLYVNCIVLYLYIYIALLHCTPIRSASRARDPERRKQSWEKKHLSHQLIKWTYLF